MHPMSQHFIKRERGNQPFLKPPTVVIVSMETTCKSQLLKGASTEPCCWNQGRICRAAQQQRNSCHGGVTWVADWEEAEAWPFSGGMLSGGAGGGGGVQTGFNKPVEDSQQDNQNILNIQTGSSNNLPTITTNSKEPFGYGSKLNHRGSTGFS